VGVLRERQDKILILTINRPEALNAFDLETFREFAQALAEFRDDPSLWVAIITGAGTRAFCIGADLRKLIPALMEGESSLPPSIMRGLEIPKPLIAAINGMALGGGLEVALACDIRIASENASFGLPEVRWGLMPGWGGTQRLPRMIPWAKAAEMIFLGERIDAQEAYRIGLVNKVVPQEELMPTALEWARKICENGPLGVRAAKEAMLRGLEMPLSDGLRLEELLFKYLLGTEDAREGVRAFAEKRKPQYRGK